MTDTLAIVWRRVKLSLLCVTFQDDGMAREWRPKSFERYDKCIVGSSMHTMQVLTDAGPAYLKAMGNPEGPHALAREFVGASLAKWFELETFDFAILEIDAAVGELIFPNNTRAEAGPAFVTRSRMINTTKNHESRKGVLQFGSVLPERCAC